jgi:endonuclease/exonuclease/phosphatase family metal-dependent hydrolase
LSAALAAGGCGAAVRMAVRQGAASCRQAEDLAGLRAQAGVRWIGPDEESERRNLDGWCETVGAALIQSSPAAASPVGTDEVAIATWNAHLGGGDLRKLVGDLRKPAKPGAPPRHVVLLLQEVFRQGRVPVLTRGTGRVPARIAPASPTGSRDDIVTLAKSLGLAVAYVPSMRNGHVQEDRGSAILSTLPLDDVDAIELPFERQRRVTVAATIRSVTPAGLPWDLRVASVHLENRSGARGLWLWSPQGRTRQARALLAGFSAAGAGVIGGDLNTWFGPREGAWKEISRVFSSVRPATTQPTYAGPAMQLDHLFFRLPLGWTAHYRRLDDTYGSDHYPLAGLIKMSNGHGGALTQD